MRLGVAVLFFAFVAGCASALPPKPPVTIAPRSTPAPALTRNFWLATPTPTPSDPLAAWHLPAAAHAADEAAEWRTASASPTPTPAQ